MKSIKYWLTSDTSIIVIDKIGDCIITETNHMGRTYKTIWKAIK
jgi:hypothetical protein